MLNTHHRPRRPRPPHPYKSNRRGRWPGSAAWASLAVVVSAPLAAATPAPALCSVHSAAAAPRVIELYTAEGCSSCPPADRWLSSLKSRRDVLPLAFHVTYWDRLGWADRYGLAAADARQQGWARAWRSPQVYTPQLLLDGRDWRDWRDWSDWRDSSNSSSGNSNSGSSATAAARLPPRAPASVAPVLTLTRDGETVTARVEPLAAITRLQAFWAVVEDGHGSAVTAGENRGATLRHDHVVRQFTALPAWPAMRGMTASLRVSAGVAAHPRRVVLVVSDADSQRPLQAVALGC